MSQFSDTWLWLQCTLHVSCSKLRMFIIRLAVLFALFYVKKIEHNLFLNFFPSLKYTVWLRRAFRVYVRAHTPTTQFYWTSLSCSNSMRFVAATHFSNSANICRLEIL